MKEIVEKKEVEELLGCVITDEQFEEALKYASHKQEYIYQREHRQVALQHTKGSIGVEIEDNLFVGDALMNMFYPTVSMLYVDEQEILLSVKYISELGEKTIYFGHGESKRNREWVK